MADICLKDISLSFPVYNVAARSFKKSFIRAATGGKVLQDTRQRVMVKALDGLNVHFAHGDRVGLIGHNGAGKSSLLRLLAGIYEPTEGEMHVRGHISPLLSFTQGLENELTGYENILMRSTIMGLTRSEIDQQAREIADLTGLGDYLAMPTRTYSSGMLVRLAFAISSSIKPDILLIDEVFGAVDADFMSRAKKRLVELLDQSSIVIMANHSNAMLQEFCNKGLVLEGGTVRFFGPIDEAFRITTVSIGNMQNASDPPRK